VAVTDPRHLPRLVDGVPDVVDPVDPSATPGGAAAVRLRDDVERVVTDVLLAAGLGFATPAPGARPGVPVPRATARPGAAPTHRPGGQRAAAWPVVAATGLRQLVDAVASALVVEEPALVADEEAALVRALARASAPVDAAPALSALLRDRLATDHTRAADLLGAG
jgi:hypothetical protein